MRVTGFVSLALLFLCSVEVQAGAVPGLINHQGVVAVSGARFQGPTGLFRFALVNDQGDVLWTNESATPGPGMPTMALSVPVANGVYSVQLGGELGMPEIPSSIFGSGSVFLRVWFDDGGGVNGVQLLAPDQQISSAAFALRSRSAEQLFIPESSAPAVTVDGAGSVGIGTTSPQGSLHLSDANSGANGIGCVFETTGPLGVTGAGLIFRRSGVIKKTIGFGGPSDTIQIYQGNGADDVPANRRYLETLNNGNLALGGVGTGGNVGIGTADPQYKLDVNGDTIIHGKLKVNSPSNSPHLVEIYHTTGQQALNINSIVDPAITGPVVKVLNTTGGPGVLMQLVGDSDSDAGGPWNSLVVEAGGIISGRYGLYHAPSDRRLKKDVSTIRNGLSRVISLRGVNYHWKDERCDNGSLQMGMIAQEVEKVFPEAVYTSEGRDGIKAVHYDHLTGAIVEAIKELNAKVESKDREIETLKARLDRLERLSERRMIAPMDRRSN